MIRAATATLLLLLTILGTVPATQVNHGTLDIARTPVAAPPIQSNATLTSFNYTLAQADIYTQQNLTLKPSPPPAGASFKPLSTFNRTSTGMPIPGTAFNFTVNANSARSSQRILWNFTAPRTSCLNCVNGTVVAFTYFGHLTKGTSSNYTLTFRNSTSIPGVPTVTHVGPLNFTSVGVSLSACPPGTVCIPVAKYVGYNMTVSFNIGWNTTSPAMWVSAGEFIVGGLGTIQSSAPTRSFANWMVINSTDSTKVNHTAKMLVNLFNSTVQYPNPLNTNQILSHTWSNQIINFYYPAGYNLTRVTVNSTLPSSPIPVLPAGSRTAFEATRCFDPACSQSLLAVNMSDIKPIGVLRNSTFTLSMVSRNSLRPTATAISVITTFGTVPLAYFAPGDNMTVKVTNKPSAVNMTVAQASPALTINFTDPVKNTQSLVGRTFSSATGGLFGFTLPQGPFGQWNVTVYYTSNFDIGFSATTFGIEQLVMVPQAVNPTISNNLLNINGKILYNSTQQPAGSVAGVVFAADAASGAIPVTASNSSTAGLYISNATLVNGVFSTGQTLTIFFTIVNPSTQQYNANVTIQHEWGPGRTHGVNQTLPLRLGDEPFNLGPVSYKMEITITQNGIRGKITSVQTQNPAPLTLSNNVTSPVMPTRQHTGLFKISVTSALANGTGLHSNSIETPPYAYVLAGPETSSGYLAHSSIFNTAADGTFSTTISASLTIGAGKLVIFALARDSNGIPLWNSNQDPTSFTDNTRLVASPDRIGELTVRQQVTATLHITNNSTLLSQTITIDLYLDSSKVDSQTVTLSPGQSTTRTFHFQAPGQPGSYSLTYSSAQYRTALASQTIQVVLVQGIIQLLIPLIIGVIAAIAVLAYYLVRRRPTTTTVVPKPAPSGPRTRIFCLQMFN